MVEEIIKKTNCKRQISLEITTLAVYKTHKQCCTYSTNSTTLYSDIVVWLVATKSASKVYVRNTIYNDSKCQNNI